MINLVSVLVVFTLFSGAVAVIAASVRGHGEAILSALAGVQPRPSEGVNQTFYNGRSSVRTVAVRRLNVQPLRAAA